MQPFQFLTRRPFLDFYGGGSRCCRGIPQPSRIPPIIPPQPRATKDGHDSDYNPGTVKAWLARVRVRLKEVIKNCFGEARSDSRQDVSHGTFRQV